MLASVALSIARRRRGFMPTSGPARREATVTSLISRVKILPFLASDAAFLCLMLAHLECPDMAEQRVGVAGKSIILPSSVAPSQKKTLHDRTPARRQVEDRG